MSEINREALKLTANTLGRAWEALVGPLGNLDRRPGSMLALEAALCRIYGSMLFHDEDVAAAFVPFGGTDAIGLGIQGATVIADNSKEAIEFPAYASGNWDPHYDGPPSLEGWGVWGYQSWSGWSVSKLGGGSNPETNPEYALRTSFANPVRWNDGTSAHVAVPYFERARYISILNNAGTVEDRVKITLTEDDLEGIKGWDSETDEPLDLQFYYFDGLVQSATFNPTVWGSVTTPSTFGTQAVKLGYEIEPGSTSGSWDVTIDIPSLTPAWISGKWWHFVMYWGSTDPTAIVKIAHSASVDIFTPTDNQIIKWARKNFFLNNLTDHIILNHLGVYDDTAYLVSRNKTHFNFVDGQYSSPETPNKYAMEESWPEAEFNGVEESLTGYIEDIDPNCAVCVILATRNNGAKYDTPSADPKVFVGPQITFEFFPREWSECDYFPPIPADYDIISRIVLYRSPGSNYGIVEGVSTGSYVNVTNPDEDPSELSNYLNKYSIAWMEQTVPTHARPPLGDEDFALYVLPKLQKALQKFRKVYSSNPVLEAAYSVLIPAARVNRNLANSRRVLADSTSNASKIFRGMLKVPLDPDLVERSEGDPLAIQFEDSAIEMLSSLAGKPTSTEILRLDSDHLYLTNRILPRANTFEIYHEPSDQCATIDASGPGTRLGMDYTFRLKFEYPDQSYLTKDWYIMASKFFLTNEEYDRRIANGQSVTGYYKYGSADEQAARSAGTLQSIDEFRLHGYAGLVPDLSMGQFRVCNTRVVSPPDETRETEEQFRKRLENQGYTPGQIDDAVQEFLANGGEFLVIDLSQYPNEFVGITNAGICATTYTAASNNYWTVDLNVEAFFEPDGGSGFPDPADARADAFTIAPLGLSAGDLEAYGTQAELGSDTSINSSGSGVEKPFINSGFAFKITTSDSSSVTDFSLRMRIAIDPDNEFGEVINPDDVMQCYLYADFVDENGDNIPGELLAEGGRVSYGELALDFESVVFTLPYDFKSGQNYWIAINKISEPQGAIVVIDGTSTTATALLQAHWDDGWIASAGDAFLYVHDDADVLRIDKDSNIGYETEFGYDSLAIKIIPSASYTVEKITLSLRSIFSSGYTSFNNDLDKGLTVELYSNSGGEPDDLLATGSVIEYRNISSDFSELISFLDYDVVNGTVYWLVITKQEEPNGGRIVMQTLDATNTLTADNVNGAYFLTMGELWVEFHNQPNSMLGAFNRDSYNVLGFLPGPNRTRVKGNTYKVEGFWSYTCDKLSQPQKLAIYPRAIYNGSSWEYVKRATDAWVVIGLKIGNTVEYKRFKLSAETNNVYEIGSDVIGGIEADGLAFVFVAKTEDELKTFTHGAPRGDRLVMRSS